MIIQLSNANANVKETKAIAEGKENSLNIFRWNILPGVFENSTVKESTVAISKRQLSPPVRLQHENNIPLLFLLPLSLVISKVFVSIKLPQ